MDDYESMENKRVLQSDHKLTIQRQKKLWSGQTSSEFKTIVLFLKIQNISVIKKVTII